MLMSAACCAGSKNALSASDAKPSFDSAAIYWLAMYLKVSILLLTDTKHVDISKCLSSVDVCS